MHHRHIEIVNRSLSLLLRRTELIPRHNTTDINLQSCGHLGSHLGDIILRTGVEVEGEKEICRKMDEVMREAREANNTTNNENKNTNYFRRCELKGQEDNEAASMIQTNLLSIVKHQQEMNVALDL